MGDSQNRNNMRIPTRQQMQPPGGRSQITFGNPAPAPRGSRHGASPELSLRARGDRLAWKGVANTGRVRTMNTQRVDCARYMRGWHCVETSNTSTLRARVAGVGSRSDICHSLPSCAIHSVIARGHAARLIASRRSRGRRSGSRRVGARVVTSGRAERMDLCAAPDLTKRCEGAPHTARSHKEQHGSRGNHAYEPALSSRGQPPPAAHSYRPAYAQAEASSASNGRGGQYSGIRSQQPPGGHSNVFDHHTYVSADQGVSTRRASDRHGATRENHDYHDYPGPPTLGESTLPFHTRMAQTVATCAAPRCSSDLSR